MARDAATHSGSQRDAYINHRLALLGLAADEASLSRIRAVADDLEFSFARVRRALPFGVEPCVGATTGLAREERVK